MVDFNMSLREVYASDAFCNTSSRSSIEKFGADEPSDFDLASACSFVKAFWHLVASPFTGVGT